MLIDETSQEFKDLFAGMDLYAPFQSRLPSHDVIAASLSDPSIDPYGTEAPVNLNLVNFQNVTDLKTGTMHMIKKIVLPSDALGTYGFLKSNTSALESVMQFESIPEFLSDEGVYQKLGVAIQGKGAADAVKGVAYAVGMSALSAMGPVGAAAAAIVGFGIMLANAFKSIKKKNAEDDLQKLLNAYAEFPPMSEPGSDFDNHVINTRLLPTLQTGDWTPIFLPRFKGGEWKGIPRLGGFALAPGDQTGATNPLGKPEQRFVPTGGVGYWPGENRITSIIQVKIDPARSPIVANFKKSGFTANNAFKQGAVQDVGDFLVSSTKLAAIAWSWVTELDNSPHLYKVDARALHSSWATYCRTGIDLVRHQSTSKEDINFYKGAIACAVGTWQCWFDGGKYKNIGGKLHGWNMLTGAGPNSFHPNRERNQGCVIGSFDAHVGKPVCIGNKYDTKTKLVIDGVQERQHWYLRHSLICAYVRKSWAAFADPALTQLLDEMRMLLLEHEDRRFVVLEDVPKNEKLPDGRDLRTELIKRGVGTSDALGLKLAARPSIQPPTSPAPELPPATSMPFSAEALVPSTTPWWKHHVVIGLGLSALVGGGLALWNRR